MTDPRYIAAETAAGAALQGSGTVWMLHPEQFEATTKAGYGHPFAGYFAGRGGAMGDVSAEVVDAAFGIFPAPLVTQMWEMGVPVHGARGGAELYIRQAAEWGRPRLAGVDGLDRFVALAEKIIDAAPALGLPLFAGWRTLPRVDDAPGRAMQLTIVLRELRGGIHMAALAAHGVTGLEAHLISNKDNEYIGMLGWPTDNLPSVDHLKGVFEEVEEATTARCAAITASVLSADEAEEFARIAQAIQAAVSQG